MYFSDCVPIFACRYNTSTPEQKMDVKQCSVTRRTTFRCSGIAEENGKCQRCNAKEKQIEAEKLRESIQKAEAEKLKIEMEQEKKRISTLVRSDVKLYSDNPRRVDGLAKNEPPWIYHRVGRYYGIFGVDGNLVDCCSCGSCNTVEIDKWEDKEELEEKKDNIHIALQRKNRHCVYCSCKACVCPARAANGQFGRIHLHAGYWDGPCQATCVICRENSDYRDDLGSCLIL